jgi:phosphoribosylanthranilate isomerase
MVMIPAIKICGLSEPETLAAAVAAGASHVGFMLFPPSPRHVGIEPLAALTRLVPPHVKTVLVTVDADDALLAGALSAARIDVIQLHGQESPARIAAVRANMGREVWAARGIRDAADLAATRDYEAVADLLLFDAKAPTPPTGGAAALPGGNGLRFDWRILDGYRGRAPWGLSGGLDAASVAEAIVRTRPSLVDVSSGVEQARGIKSPEKIRAFIAAARGQ